MHLLDPAELELARQICRCDLEQLAESLSISQEVQLQHREALDHFLLFRHTDRFRHPQLRELSPSVRFHNAYFWFRILVVELERTGGPDAGLQQQSEQLLADAPSDADDWDWGVIEQLDAHADSCCRRAHERDPRIDAVIAELDRRMAEQLRVILARPELCALERIWTSLRRMVWHVQVGDHVELEILSCSKDDLAAQVVLREAHHSETLPCEDESLWGLACWPLAMRLASSFARYGWCANIVGTDPEAGGLVHGFRPETPMSERDEHELSFDLGLAPLMDIPSTPLSVFHSASTIAAPKYFDRGEEGQAAELNFRLGHCMLPYLMMTCRVAHYLQVVFRDHDWARLDRADQEQHLNRWLSPYVADARVVDAKTRARRILRKVEVKVDAAEDGEPFHRFHLRMRPHFKYMGAFFALHLEGRLPRNNTDP